MSPKTNCSAVTDIVLKPLSVLDFSDFRKVSTAGFRLKLVPMASALAAVMFCSLSLQAHANAELAQQKNCLNCHQIDAKLVGPPYKMVAAKYRSDADAESRLVRKVLEGSFGTWGQIPMPANPITEAEAHTLVKWVLSQ